MTSWRRIRISSEPLSANAINRIAPSRLYKSRRFALFVARLMAAPLNLLSHATSSSRLKTRSSIASRRPSDSRRSPAECKDWRNESVARARRVTPCLASRCRASSPANWASQFS